MIETSGATAPPAAIPNALAGARPDLDCARLVCCADGRPARVLQLVHIDGAGGVEALASLLGRELTAAGAFVETAFLYGSGDLGPLGKIVGAMRAGGRLLASRPDVVIAYQTTACLVAGLLGPLVGCRMRIAHQTALPSAGKPVGRLLDKLAGSAGLYTVNIANSHATEAAFRDYPAAYRERMTCIVHGLPVMTPGDTRQAVRRRHGLPLEGPLLVNVGRLSAQKAQQQIIAAMPLLPSAHLAIAGTGPRRAELGELAASLGVADRVHFLGFLDQQAVADLTDAGDVFVFPSEWETFGLAPVEAAMIGVPLVVSDLDVLREVLSVHGETTARFVQGASPAAWSEAVRAALSAAAGRDEARAFALRIRETYSVQRMVSAYAKLIRAAI